MRLKIAWGVVAIATAGVSLGARAQSTDERAAARAVVGKYAGAMVAVRATVHIQGSVSGKDLPARDQTISAGAAVLDPSGLAVLSLSRLEPDESLTRALTQLAPTAKVDVSSELTGVQLRLPNGREVPAHVVLRDQDLDLAFVRPEAPLPAPLAAIDAPSAKPILFDLLVVLLHGVEPDGTGVAAGLAYVDSIVQKPRLYFSRAGTTSVGAPVFDKAGSFVGLVVLRKTGPRNTAPSILPADDLREIAKQAK
jgi:hypothetical protein